MDVAPYRPGQAYEPSRAVMSKSGIMSNSECLEKAMNISSKKRSLMLCAYLAPVVCGLGGFGVPADAENAVSPSQSYSAALPATSGAAVLTDEELQMRVKGALHAAPYLYDGHVTVFVEHGAVVLRGFVFSDSDLLDAIRIASKAAGDRRVIDELSIEREGRR
jgi:osmotically-inducible protein OsmY